MGVELDLYVADESIDSPVLSETFLTELIFWEKNLSWFKIYLMRTLLLFFLLISSQIVHGQDWECDLLNKGMAYYENEKVDSALIVWESVVENYPDTSICYGRIFNNIPILYAQQENLKESKKWFQKIIDSSLNDLAEGDNLMAQYANYKHNACLRMSSLLKDENKIVESFEYIFLAETKFPYQTRSATSFEKSAVSITYVKADLWKLKGNEKEALFVMLEKILDNDVFFRKTDAASFSSVPFYNGLVEEVLPMIEEQYGAANFKEQFIASISKLVVKTVRIGADRQKAKIATFIFDGRKFAIGSSSKKYNKKKFINKLTKNQILEELKS